MREKNFLDNFFVLYTVYSVFRVRKGMNQEVS